HAASLYPLLYRLERRRLVAGRWIEQPGVRRRRFYSLTRQGRKALAAQRQDWRAFLAGMQAIVLEGEA
ncbi:MAG: helix-turn-helix transcriptional regulator, partial [Terriglobales bacterium]